MPLLRYPDQSSIQLQLRRDLVRSIKRGHCWVYAEALRDLPPAQPGTAAILFDNRGGREIGRGFYDPGGGIALRICTTRRGELLDDTWAANRMRRAIALRKCLFDESTTAYRLFNGEGDGLPGLVCDRYADAAVVQFDGQAAIGFWHAPGIAQWLAEQLAINLVVERVPGSQSPQTRVLLGEQPSTAVDFMEHGVHFSADLQEGQKTGFYIDQRENRYRMQKYASGKRVLNMFGYTGGFSVYAGLGGANHVTTVDRAKPALDAAEDHWSLNGLPLEGHTVVQADAFEYLNTVGKQGKSWEVVILDPPSFAHSIQAIPKALSAYEKLIAAGAAVTEVGGILAAGSCSSHISMDDFMHVCQEGVSKARYRATTLGIYTQPEDHPVPLAMREFRYLKFIIMRLER